MHALSSAVLKEKSDGVSMKGIALPVQTIVIMALAVIVLVGVGAFFATQSTSGISRADAARIFSTGCQTLCADTIAENQALALALKNGEHADFLDACAVMGVPDARDLPGRCLDACNNCQYAETGGTNEALARLRCELNPSNCAS